MSKAEKFISEHIKTCSNVIIDCQVVYNGVPQAIYKEWLTPDQARRAVEIAREEMFEKVCEFLDNNLCCYIEAQHFAIEYQRLENDLKQAMKDE